MGHWRDDLDVYPRNLPTVDLDIRKTALMVIDIQKYDTSREHGLAFAMKKFPEMYDYYFNVLDNVVLPNNVRLLEYFRKNNMQVVYLAVGTELQDGRDQTPRRKRRDIIMTERTGVNFPIYKGSELHKIHPLVKPIEGELVVNKNSTSAFNSTGIDQFLRNLDITGLIITGLVTNTCVETTARDAADRGYECVLIEDACAAFDQESHEATLRIFARFFGEVWTTDQAIENINNLLDTGVPESDYR